MRAIPGAATGDLHQVHLATEDAPWGSLSVPDFEDLEALDGDQLSLTAVGSNFFLATVRLERLTRQAPFKANRMRGCAY